MSGLTIVTSPRVTFRDGVGLIAISAGLGAVLGVAWWAWAPRVVLDVFGDATFPAEFQPGGYITDDAIAALACMAGGVLTMGVAAILARRRGGSMLAYPTLGWALIAGAVGAVVLWWTGSQLGAVDLAAAVAAAGDGGQVEAPLVLRMPGVLVLWPLASALVFTLAAWVAWFMRSPSQ